MPRPRPVYDLLDYPPELRQIAADMARSIGSEVLNADSIPPAGPVQARWTGRVQLVDVNPRHVARPRRRRW